MSLEQSGGFAAASGLTRYVHDNSVILTRQSDTQMGIRVKNKTNKKIHKKDHP